MATKTLYNNEISADSKGLDFITTNGEGNDFRVPRDTLFVDIHNILLKPMLISQVGQMRVDLNMQTQSLKTYNDGVYEYILCDGTAGYKLADYPYLKDKIATYAGEGGEILFNAPNAIDRTIRQVSDADNLLMLQEDDIKAHGHDMTHDHDMSHQHGYHATRRDRGVVYNGNYWDSYYDDQTT